MVGRRAIELTAAVLVAARLMSVAITPTEPVTQPAGSVYPRIVRAETNRARRQLTA